MATTTAFGAAGAGIIAQAATASAGTIAITSVGSLGAHLGYLASSTDRLQIAPEATGDLVVVAVINDTWATQVTSVSGGSVGSWQPAGSPFLDAS
ncbi:MAG TPA: hypothetical protein VFN61_12335, partial [Acidimicrobiales bacterium]|nr:hypothetical protein [Acidimicrobiales bacterium]